MPVRSLKDATIYISDVDGRHGANTITVDVEDGDLSWTERYPVNIISDRGVLNQARSANRNEAEFSFSTKFQSFVTHAAITPYEGLKGIDGASAWVSAGHIGDAFMNDIEILIADPAGGTGEWLNFNPAKAEEVAFTEGDPNNVLSYSGRSPIVSPLGSGIIDGIMAYYRLGEASDSERKDSSLNEFHLTDGTTVARNASGKIGGAADFIAANTEVLNRTSESGIQFGDIDYSGVVWFRITDVTANRGLLGKSNSTAAQREMALYFNTTSDRLALRHYTDAAGANTLVQTAANSVLVNTWHMAKFRHDASADTIEIGIDDNDMVSGATGGGGNTGASDLFLGAIYDESAVRYMQGMIDEVLITKDFLTNTEFDFLYHSGQARSYPLAS